MDEPTPVGLSEMIPLTGPAASSARRRAHDVLRTLQWRAEQRPGTPPPGADDPPGWIWIWDGGQSWLWCLESTDSPNEGILAGLVFPPEQVETVWNEVVQVGTARGWQHLSYSAFAPDPVATAIADRAPHRVVATKLQVDVTATPAPRDVVLEPMSPARFATFRARSIEMYVEQALRAGMDSDPRRVRSTAEQITDEALPQGPATPGHWVCQIRRGSDIVGDAWLAEQETRTFLYDIVVEESARGQGIGTQALRACAARTREAGHLQLGLNVFGSNPRAQDLYLREGFVETERILQLDLTA